ncbi:MAG: lysylphosphatidylglycerol synthase transmembrane domain-containing protein [Myxococcota bacterium]
MPSDPVPSAAASTPPQALWRRGLWLRLIVALVLALAFVIALWPYLRAIPADLQIAPAILAAYAATLVPYILLRAGRWHALVAPLGDVRRGQTLRVSLAGYMWIALLPFRLGELARPLFLAQRSEITVQRALGTVAIERVLDGLVICGLFFVASAGRTEAELSRLALGTTGLMAIFFGGLVTLVLMARWPTAAGVVLDATVGRIWPRLGRWAADLSQGVAQGLAALPRGGALSTFVLVTLAYWASNAVGMWVLARGCDLPLDLSGALLVMATMNIALLVPGGPAQLGIFQTGVALGLHLALPDRAIGDEGSKFAFYLYLGQLAAIVISGLWAQRSLALDWRAVLTPRVGPTTNTATNTTTNTATPEDPP